MPEPLTTEPASLASLIGASQDVPGSFAEQAYLSYLIPSSTNSNIQELLQRAESGKTAIHSIKQRESLFFGT
jgi:hypothetical protein